MRSKTVLVGMLIFLAGCAMTKDLGQAPIETQRSQAKAAALAEAVTDPPIDAPVFTIGDQWTYKTLFAEFTVEVVEITPDGGSVIMNSRRPGTRLTRDQHLTVRGVEGNTDPREVVGRKFMDFPALPRKTFSFKTQGTTGDIAVDVKMVRYETVKVPAGTFQALRIESCWRNLSRNSSDCGMVHWYAPEVKAMIKRETPSNWRDAVRNNDYQLISYVPAKQ